ncbi:MAG TPA: heme biosynthesis HemY N-terminal domain-containing protein [Xanthobacteraceae bacterium]|nr:heme biosynthesis HemY N-terminal domain-containing protein [Xanthobacteraceae bacterium]
MIRVVFFLIIVGALALGVAWLADRPGDVVVAWQGWRIETSLMVLGAALLVAMTVLALLWTLLRAILRSPLMLRMHLHHRRGERAYEAISRGLIAVGAGDLGAARKHAAEAQRIAPAEPLALLLSAQHAQLAGDRETAESAFRAMASRADTKALGLHGLFIESRRRGDHASAHAFAEEAARENPSLGWADRAVLEFRCVTGDWAGALALLEGKKRALDKESYRRQRAVMLTARALALQETDRDNAKAFALEAAKLAPTLVPAAAVAGRMLAEGGEQRKATRVVDKAWRANPHPDLAQVFAELRFGDAARDRLKRVEAWAQKVPGHIEGALALARAAIDAQQYAKARAALAPHLAALTKRVALLMAELERAERNDEGRAREWIARAVNAAPDPAWTADGHVSNRWLPVSPVSGRLDAFEWRTPLASIASAPAAIEPEPSAAAPVASEPHSDSAQIAHDKEAATIAGEKAEPPAAAAEPAADISSRRRARPPQPKPEPVIPLVHAPDDPGPDAVEESEAPPEAQNGGWRKIFE